MGTSGVYEITREQDNVRFHKARGLQRGNGAVHHLEHGSHRRAQIKKQLPEIEFGAFALIHWPSISYSIILVI